MTAGVLLSEAGFDGAGKPGESARMAARFLDVARAFPGAPSRRVPWQAFRPRQNGRALPSAAEACLFKAEAAAAQRGCRVAAESSGEGEPDRFLVFLGKTGLAGKGVAAERCPLPDLLRVGGAVAQRQEGAVEDVGVEREQADFVDEAARRGSVGGCGLCARRL